MLKNAVRHLLIVQVLKSSRVLLPLSHLLPLLDTFEVGRQLLDLLLIRALDLLEVVLLILKSYLVLLFLVDEEEVGLFQVSELLDEVEAVLELVFAVPFIKEVLQPWIDVHFISSHVG